MCAASDGIATRRDVIACLRTACVPVCPCARVRMQRVPTHRLVDLATQVQGNILTFCLVSVNIYQHNQRSDGW